MSLSTKRFISADEGHGSMDMERKCPDCDKPTILHDSGWEYCSECEWKSRGE